MPEGMIVKALSGFYYVQVADQLIQCKARGIFKKRGITPLVGDRVKISVTGSVEGVVEEIFPRSVSLIRPPIANVEQAVLVFSAKEPALNRRLLDRMLVLIEKAHIEASIVITKIDLLQEGESLDEQMRLYKGIGYPVYAVSVKSAIGLEEVRRLFHNRISVLAGQSGVGKSSLLNGLYPSLQLKMGEVSQKLGRGRHTTRHVELIAVDANSYIADTPGFSQLDFGDMEPEELDNYFKEIARLSDNCYYRECLHETEHDCAVIETLRQGKVNETRYGHYIEFLKELRELKETRYS
ncbi:ribosome small subunit-dependent GTPase A [Effusibacillus dendaii]|uniref:Small ribosomal subunit biogenesis GTPase RsgA n=1 Tax=Effusibacillus dendaii TaxID=2743772 RepID=A0A7I8D7Z7_9BACL|nr:ribosome small subunit-dependent GTPase A [Effusibacillus dendaii]BCJ85129.1 putative ribosome biogenesis GTPase RsgA [Effusibacillus dendaii]